MRELRESEVGRPKQPRVGVVWGSASGVLESHSRHRRDVANFTNSACFVSSPDLDRMPDCFVTVMGVMGVCIVK